MSLFSSHFVSILFLLFLLLIPFDPFAISSSVGYFRSPFVRSVHKSNCAASVREGGKEMTINNRRKSNTSCKHINRHDGGHFTHFLSQTTCLLTYIAALAQQIYIRLFWLYFCAHFFLYPKTEIMYELSCDCVYVCACVCAKHVGKILRSHLSLIYNTWTALNSMFIKYVYHTRARSCASHNHSGL